MVIVSIQVPIEQFPRYVCKLVGELYDTVEAVVKGRLKGPGALGTLVLCESLLSYLSIRHFERPTLQAVQ